MFQKLTNFIFELQMLRRIKHEGWRVAGIRDPESVAEHSLTAAQIAFILAKMEKHPEPHKIVTMVIFHDIAECRVGDVHKIADRYIQKDELRAVSDQTKDLNKIGKEIKELWEEVENGNEIAGIIAKDADLLEQAFLAKQYMEQGYKDCQNWIDNIAKFIITDSAKNLLKTLQKTDSNEWRQHLKKVKKA